MENIIDMIAMDSEAAKISDELKDLLYQKAAKKGLKIFDLKLVMQCLMKLKMKLR